MGRKTFQIFDLNNIGVSGDFMENLFVECEDEAGVAAYREIVEYLMMDMNVKNLDALRIYADPKTPLFSCQIEFKAVEKPLTINDISVARVVGDEFDLVIGEERYIPEILRRLWDIYGRDNVEQPERSHILVKKEGVDLDGLLGIVIVDPSKEIYDQLVTLALQIIPVGFRVRHVEYGAKSVLVVASEAVIEPEWVNRVKERFGWSS
ncbi:methanogenesis marker 17 protein [Methanosarcinales archaeon ex4572_44]|nr:MAG: methanogenesis marker 17 protein [Methanosarcinales archaeon ex4484_138]PHP46241.1 MAG: methanogenesis marker 17 protein [Methanosarcinales archaeon ex4572_44]RLG25835.1 MAG: methanogenesis marker 17 protein [Methanosarcinales archaeon]RLG26624.1 MAG: methanogenesis marker 17 protein [Methanosarcinales archaeon]HHI30085.1 methanogenesis marker 17 protein [Candidatus Methanoperedenaceae archaeon]